MSGRCKACNSVLDESEMTTKWPGTDEFCDLCGHCLDKVTDDSEDTFWDTDMISIDDLPESLE